MSPKVNTTCEVLCLSVFLKYLEFGVTDFVKPYARCQNYALDNICEPCEKFLPAM